MVKIIKEGDLSRFPMAKRFECQLCGCVFDASAAEYRIETAKNGTFYCCTCPTCKMEVVMSEQPTEMG